jgi:hypothetical protein
MMREQANLLDHIPDVATQFVGFQGAVIVAENGDLACCRFFEPVDHP